MQLPIEISATAPGSLQGRIVLGIRDLILTSRLKPGTRMPASRELSDQLNVSRNTVIYAYERLTAEGYLETRKGVGTFVSHSIPEESLLLRARGERAAKRAPASSGTRITPLRFRAPQLYERPRERVGLDFRIGRPDAKSFPVRIWRRLIEQSLTKAGFRMTQYGNPAGLHELRCAIAAHLGPARGIDASPDQIIIVGGCEEGLNIVAKILAPAGATVCVENPCYQGVAFVFESYGARMTPISIDSEGIEVSRLPEGEVSLVCVTPSHQFPIGITMSLPRRLRLLDWANRTGAYIVEDDYDSDFRYDGSPLTALAGLDHGGCVIYVGTFSKSIGAALRLGYLVVPRELIGAGREAKALLDNGNPWLDQAVVADFLTSGSFGNHLRRIRQTYLQRRDCLISSLRAHFGDVELVGSEGGMHLTWVLPQGAPDARSIQYSALHRDVGVYTVEDGPAFDYGIYARRDRALFLGYPCLTEREIREGVKRLSEVIARRAAI